MAYNTDYLKFDAATIRSAVEQKLSDDGTFTDHLYPGSNLSTIVDVFSYMFEVMMYYTNHGASEAMFTDTKLYENMNRIVKMLSYNPRGMVASQTDVQLSATNLFTGTSLKILPKYSYIDTGLTDSDGNNVYYSTLENYFVEPTIPETTTDTLTMVNGRWQLYERTFTSAGQPFEEYVLDNIDMEDEDNPRYIAHPYIDAYVKRDGEYIPFKAVSEGTLFGSGVSIVGPNENVFEIRLNDNKRYSMKFGDGIHGSKLKDGDEIYIVYLASNGLEGDIGAGVINTTDSTFKTGVGKMNVSMFNSILNLTSDELLSDAELQNLGVANIAASTTPSDIETVDDIRNNAPVWHRMNGRLVTVQDYRQYVTATYKNDIYDSYVMNNWSYLAEFHAWLYEYDKLDNDIRNLNYIYADSCDCNNVYIWNKYKYEISTDFIERDLLPRKDGTAEPILLDAIDTYFVPANTNNGYDLTNFDPNVENFIQIVKDKNSIVPAERIKQNAIEIIREFFNPEKRLMGDTIDLNDLYNRLQGIDGAGEITTVFLATGETNGYNRVITNGISFGVWTQNLIEGADFEILTGNVKLKNFQFPVLLDSDIESRVKVVFETYGQPSVEY